MDVECIACVMGKEDKLTIAVRCDQGDEAVTEALAFTADMGKLYKQAGMSHLSAAAAFCCGYPMSLRFGLGWEFPFLVYSRESVCLCVLLGTSSS